MSRQQISEQNDVRIFDQDKQPPSVHLISGIENRLQHRSVGRQGTMSLRYAFDYFFLMRPVLMGPVWTMLLVGYYQGNVTSYAQSNRFLLPMMVLFSILMGGHYIVNQLFDIETDRFNAKLYLIPDGYVSLGLARLQGIFCFTSSTFLAFMFGTAAGLLFLLSFLLGIFYSCPPFRLKDKLIPAFLSNAIGFGFLAFAVGWISGSRWAPNIIIHSIPYVFAIAAVYANTVVLDMKGDGLSGKITLAVKYGAKLTVILSIILLTLAIGSGFLIGDSIILFSGLVSFPFFVRALFSGDDMAISRASKVAILALALRMAWEYPLFLIVILITFLISRVYYSIRFNMTYPSLFGK